VTFDAIPSGSDVFIDANALVFAFDSQSPYHPACRKLLDRVENGDLQGFTAAHVLCEMSHRLMTIEAVALFNRPLAGLANWLRRHPTEVQQLSRSRQALDELTLVRVTVLPVSGAHVSRAADFSRQHGLLTNDAVIVAVMQAQGLTALAGLDADFDRVPGLTRYAPV
jgi:predicted nucleic acid-binding protein